MILGLGCAGRRELRVAYPPSEVPDGKMVEVVVVRASREEWMVEVGE